MSLNDLPEEIFAVIGKLLTSHDAEAVMTKIEEIEAVLTAKLVEIGNVKKEITHLLNFNEGTSAPETQNEPLTPTQG